MDRLLHDARVAPLIGRWGRLLVKHALGDLIAERRTPSGGGTARFDVDHLVQRAGNLLAARYVAPLEAVLNLTGTLLHTNLGRASLPVEAAAAMLAASGPVLLEMDPATGARGGRESHVAGLLEALTGAEAATVVNNTAAALLLVLNEFARDREVPVSRGELIEIGGSFRLPELMQRAGCRLLEVGTTNRTHPRDYERAVGTSTALILKVHPSNYEIRGFTTAVPTRELANLAHARGLPLVVDLGSGSLVDLTRHGLPAEAHPREVLADGADLVLFSGDKLLGGPQMGVIVGRRDLVRAINANPLKRALRVDKARLAAMAAVLRLYADEPHIAAATIPLLRQLAVPLDELQRRGEALRAQVGDHFAPWFAATVVTARTQIGSGAMPGAEVDSHALAFAAQPPLVARHVEALAAALRRGLPPVIGRVQGGQLRLDLRACEDDALLARCLLDVNVSALS